MKIERKCTECDLKLNYWQKYTCSAEHRAARELRLRNGAPTRKQLRTDRKGERLDRPRFTEIPAQKKKPVLITDEEQKRINKAVDDKHSIAQPIKIYKPGSPEFNQIAAELMGREMRCKPKLTSLNSTEVRWM